MTVPPYTLRPATPADEPFLFALYRGTREQEVAAWGLPPAQLELLLKMQFDAQRRHYATLPGLEHHLVLVQGEPAGRLMVSRTEAEHRLVDVALLPERRGGGVGAALVRALQQEAARAGRPLRLQVLAGNPARRLYERLGFRATGENGPHIAMEWRG